MEPSGMDDLSIDVSEMQSDTDPGEVGSESIPTSLAGELQRLRFSLREIKGTDQWYETPTVGLQGIITSTVTATSGSNTLVDEDQGTVLSVTNTNTQTLPDADAVGAGWAMVIFNNGTGTVTVEGHDSQTVSGFANIKLYPRDSIVLTSDGSNFIGIETRAGVGNFYPHAGSNEPPWGLFCNGQAVSRTDYAQLYAIIGNTYGNGDGSTTFNVPDYRDRSPLGENTMGASDASRVDNYSTSLGDAGGADQHTLTTGQMPSHRHSLSMDSGEDTLRHVDLGHIPGALNQDNNTSSPMSSAGGDNPHNNMHPFLTCNFVIVF